MSIVKQLGKKLYSRLIIKQKSYSINYKKLPKKYLKRVRGGRFLDFRQPEYLSDPSKIITGDNVHLGYMNRYYLDGNLIIGNNSSIGSHSIIWAISDIKIGNDVLMASNVTLCTVDHIFNKKDSPIRKQGIKSKGIIIEDNCWIAEHVIILKGVHIGRNCVIGAGSVVTKDIPSNSLVVGTCAKPIKTV